MVEQNFNDIFVLGEDGKRRIYRGGPIVTLDLEIDENEIKLNMIRSHNQKNGDGTFALKLLTTYANITKRTITGIADGGNEIPMDKLLGWYKKLGFKTFKYNHLIYSPK